VNTLYATRASHDDGGTASSDDDMKTMKTAKTMKPMKPMRTMIHVSHVELYQHE